VGTRRVRSDLQRREQGRGLERLGGLLARAQVQVVHRVALVVLPHLLALVHGGLPSTRTRYDKDKDEDEDEDEDEAKTHNERGG